MFAFVTAILFALALSRTTRAIVPRVDTGYAVYLGNHSLPNTAAFLGIPYAEPPVGERRFRAPLPLDTSRLRSQKGTVDATKYPDFCIQGTTGGGDAGGAGSEDCLKVNIYTPVNATSHSNLPVLVYIHGGGYIFGNPRNWPFDHWIQQSPNVVVVSVYYRVDIFGFLAHPALSDSTLGDLNAGFLDQMEALRWVQNNIKAFGGDPKKVTINGQSAGASSVELHLVANEGKNALFSGAIAQSVYRATLATPQQQEPLFNYLLGNTSCTLPTPAAQLSCLRNATVSALIRSADSAGSHFNGPYRLWIPVLDGKIFSDAPTNLLLSGRWAKVPVIAGATSNETAYSGNVTADIKRMFPQITTAQINEILAQYPLSEFDSVTQQGQVVTGELQFRCGRELIGGVAAREALPSFGYRYNQPNPSFGFTTVTGHAAENWMMFLGTNTGFNGSTTFTGLNATETAFSQELIAYWLSFVRSSNPNTFRLARSPVWPSFSLSAGGRRQVLQQDPKNSTTMSGISSEAEPQNEASRCQFTFSLANVMDN